MVSLAMVVTKDICVDIFFFYYSLHLYIYEDGRIIEKT
jgi:hypothetical protein